MSVEVRLLTDRGTGESFVPITHWNAVSNKPVIPTKTSDLQNDSGFLTEIPTASSSTLGGIKVGTNLSISDGVLSATDTTYTASDFDIKDLADSTDLKTTWSEKLDSISDLLTIREGAALGATALLSFTESDPTVPSWAKASSKPSYTASEVGALPDSTVIPDKVSLLTNDSGFITSIPTASSSTIGGVKINGNNLSIDSNGVLSATDTTYSASDFDIKDLSDSTNLKTTWNSKQDQLTTASTLYINSLDCDGDVICGRSGTTMYKLSDIYSAAESDWAIIGKTAQEDGLKFTALSDNSTISFVNYNGNKIAIDYSVDDGVTWHHLTEGNQITLSAGEFVLINGSNDDGIGKLDGSTIKYSTFVMTGSFEASGNIMYLLDELGKIKDVPAYCFYRLFDGCTSLTKAPKLPARDLTDYCYYEMFSGCSSLNYVECLAITKSATGCVDYWLDGVATNGTFVSAPYADWSGKIPSTWSKEDEYEEYKSMYLTFDILTSGTVKWNSIGSGSAKTIEYSINDGSWTSITASSSSDINVVAEDKIRFRGTNASYAKDKSNYSGFEGGTATFNVQGNIMSLIYGDNFVGQTAFNGGTYNFCSLFKASTVVSAEFLVLPALTLTDHCYRAMFSWAQLLEVAPYLPATTLARNCYWYMFEQTAITKSPILYALTIPVEGCGNMFLNCSNLAYIECYATTRTATNATQSWVNGVSGRGVFVKNEDMNSWPSGVNGIPRGWEVIDKPID